MPVLKISAASTSAKSIIKTEWAELLDSTQTVVDFHEKINDPAVKYGFELDTFQKLVLNKNVRLNYFLMLIYKSEYIRYRLY